MSYKINERIIFNEMSGTLTKIGPDDESVALIRSTSRLLSFLIRHNNELLLRERLLDEVLVDYGLKASNNNLNNYISILRKSLAQLGEEELIITYPRQGFKFVASHIQKLCIDTGPTESIGEPEDHDYKEIEAQTNAKNTAEPIHTIEDSQLNVAPVTEIHNAASTKVRVSAMYLLAFIGTLLMLFSAVYLYEKDGDMGVHPLGNYQKCQIYTVKSSNSSLYEMSGIIQNRGFDCQKNANVYYYSDVRNADEDASMAVITFCPVGINKPCINSYINKKNQ